MIDISQLKSGDIVRHIASGNSYTVTIVYENTGRVFAVREIEISNPDEWQLIEKPADYVPSPVVKKCLDG